MSIEERRRIRVVGEVRAVMARKRVTAPALSAKVGSPPATLSRKLTGKSSLIVDELLDISDALDVDAAVLLHAAQEAAAMRDVRVIATS
jgi:hypothetical protein